LIDRLPWRAHSTETVTIVHIVNELKTSTIATEGTAASPSTILASGRPSIRLLEKTPPSANTDCDTPSRPNSFQPTSRPMPKTMTQLPKKAIRRRASTGGSFDKPDIRRNIIAGRATTKTKDDRLSATSALQRVRRMTT